MLSMLPWQGLAAISPAVTTTAIPLAPGFNPGRTSPAQDTPDRPGALLLSGRLPQHGVNVTLRIKKLFGSLFGRGVEHRWQQTDEQD